MLKILWYMLEFDDWQHQNHVSLQTVKVGHYTKKEKKKFNKKSPHCDLDHEDSKTIFLRDTLAHDDASPYYTLWLMMMHHHTTSGYKSLNVLEIPTGHWKTFTVNTAIFSQDTPAWWWYTIHCQSLHWQFRRYDRNSHALSTGVTLTIQIMIRSAGDGGNI